MRFLKILSIATTVLFSSALYASEPSVSWVTTPPSIIYKGQTVLLSWEVENLSGSFHSLCTFCPEALGPNCKKGHSRQQTATLSGSNRGNFSSTFTFDEETTPGNYFLVAYGAYSPQSYHATSPIKIVYDNSSNPEKSSSSSSLTTVNDKNDSSTSTIVVVPDHLYEDGYVVIDQSSDDYPSSANQAAAEQQSAENQKNRQEAAANNQEQRQETSTTNQQQRQDALTGGQGNQSHAHEGQEHRGSERHRREGGNGGKREKHGRR